MIPSERRQIILDLLANKDIVTIHELLEVLNVSNMTIRRDLQKLEDDNLLTIVSGGITSNNRVSTELSRQIKATLNEDKKDLIGQLALTKISNNSCIYLDAGTTTLAVAKHLAKRKDLTIITNDFMIMTYLIENSTNQLIHTGGTVCAKNYSCVGHATAKSIENYFIDVAFISSSSWDLKGISTPHEDKIPVKQAAANSSKHTILVADSSKYDKVATHLALPINKFDTIITSQGLTKAVYTALRNKGIDVIIAG